MSSTPLTYYLTYSRLMEHWEKVLPVDLYRQYETLVHYQERESRLLLERTGMGWEDTCLEFYNGDSPVTTFSNLQVRRPMFRSSIGRWKRHRGLLGDLFRALGPLSPISSAEVETGSGYDGPLTVVGKDTSPMKDAR